MAQGSEGVGGVGGDPMARGWGGGGEWPKGSSAALAFSTSLCLVAVCTAACQTNDCNHASSGFINSHKGLIKG